MQKQNIQRDRPTTPLKVQRDRPIILLTKHNRPITHQNVLAQPLTSLDENDFN
ncbi:hypothetical protein H6F42_16770 [Pseudanabaena sp. FACHB-1998]|uniref:hypothetical protein n=1 Tax=Pseudanabaena sp. FACHB-1998 TaxID=2692858 RepID=UPI001680DACE|nr:hypothetical protein [Pseudanabaena sp. FACHB-1998]MBD2178572.1 hypothetical protein [Pseudanabaena sp. FACHB-1998]